MSRESLERSVLDPYTHSYHSSSTWCQRPSVCNTWVRDCHVLSAWNRTAWPLRWYWEADLIPNGSVNYVVVVVMLCCGSSVSSICERGLVMVSGIHDVTVVCRIGSTVETTLGISIVAVLTKGCLGQLFHILQPSFRSRLTCLSPLIRANSSEWIFVKEMNEQWFCTRFTWFYETMQLKYKCQSTFHSYLPYSSNVAKVQVFRHKSVLLSSKVQICTRTLIL